MHLRGAMSLKANFIKRTFHFGFNARTSRGAMKEKDSWFIMIRDEQTPEVFGVGECGPLPGLSIEDFAELEQALSQIIEKINSAGLTLHHLSPFTANDAKADMRNLNIFLTTLVGEAFLHRHPAVTFAMETALLDLAHSGTRLLFDNSFVQGNPIPINGLVWMGGLDFMLQQVEIKIRDGFRCVKLKVGGMDFEKECDILQYIRRKYFREKIEVRLDANGAFKIDEVLYKLHELSKFEVHSIEQPIAAGSKELPELCKNSPIPIALDEELIGIASKTEKEGLLDRIRPQYIILKPSLHGGLFACQEWIELAEACQVGWWITSALESNVGLNAVAQFTANHTIQWSQGLGTGEIYSDNIPSPLQVKNGQLLYNSAQEWDFSDFD